MTAALQYLLTGKDDAQRLAAALGIAAHAIAVHRFPDSELRVTIGPAAETTIIYAPLDHPNDKLVTLLLATEALRRDGARRLVLVAPYLCYMRQDIAFTPRQAVSQKAIGALLARLVDRIVTVDAHLHRTARIGDVFPGIEADNLSAMPAIADALRGAIDPQTILVGPDAESRAWVTELAGLLQLDSTVGQKQRYGDQSVTIAFEMAERLRGRPALLVDDIVSSGATLATCAKTLRTCGAARIDAVITHALFPPELVAHFRQAGIDSVKSTTSVPHPTNAIRLDGVLAHALRWEVHP